MNELLATIKSQAQEMAEELTALRRDFHQYPELSHQEERTARVVAEYLRNLGMGVRTGIAGHGVVADLQGSRPGRTVAYRADMDALPIAETVQVPWRSRVDGVMHACGHDFHVSLALAAGQIAGSAPGPLGRPLPFHLPACRRESGPGWR